MFQHFLLPSSWFDPLNEISSHGKFKFVFPPWFLSVIHLLCASFETKIGHESLNFV
jgi:hypothetical protein